jgi:hypothetical protein
MIDILQEITEIPFQVFWDKYKEIKPGKYNQSRTGIVWFYMYEDDRKTAFEQLAKNNPSVGMFNEPYEYLSFFCLPI